MVQTSQSCSQQHSLLTKLGQSTWDASRCYSAVATCGMLFLMAVVFVEPTCMMALST